MFYAENKGRGAPRKNTSRQYFYVFNDLFSDEKVKRLRRKAPHGVEILLLLMCIASKHGMAGAVMWNDTTPYTPVEMAEDYDYAADEVQLVWDLLLDWRVLVINEEGWPCLRNWAKYQQPVTDYEKRLESDRERQRKHRESVKNGEQPALTLAQAPTPEPEKKEKTYSVEAAEMATKLVEIVKEHNPNVKVVQSANVNKSAQKWAKVFDLMHCRDNRSWEDIREVLDFIAGDIRTEGRFPGWGKVVQSADSVREKFDTIQGQMSRPAVKPAGASSSNHYSGMDWGAVADRI